MVAHEDEPGPDPHPYWYARVVGIFHVDVLRRGESSPPKRMDFLWVRWYGRDMHHRAGWKSRRLHRVGFIDSSDPAAYGFLDPANVIRAVHLIPAFDLGRSTAYLTGPIIRPARLEDSEWRQFYVNQYVPFSDVLYLLLICPQQFCRSRHVYEVSRRRRWAQIDTRSHQSIFARSSSSRRTMCTWGW